LWWPKPRESLLNEKLVKFGADMSSWRTVVAAETNAVGATSSAASGRRERCFPWRGDFMVSVF
jgi:hypothetical protein